MGKKTILCLLILLVFAFPGIASAAVAENPFRGLTQEQVINKYFEGRQSDTIEGIWLDDSLKQWVIIKSNLIDPNKKYGDYDYLMVELSSSTNVFMDGVSKTQYSPCFKFKKSHLRFLSPNALYYPWTAASVFTRIYPSEVK